MTAGAKKPRWASGAEHPGWKGGRTVTRPGYVAIHRPGHPRANAGGYVYEHILVVEAALGHYLRPTAPVHHVDECKSNNAPTNLVACHDAAYHQLLHRRMRALIACGDANAHRCKYCKRYDNQHDITIERLRAGFFSAYHRRCNTDYQIERNRRLAANGDGAHLRRN